MNTDFQKLVCTEMKSVYIDLVDQLIFSGHWYIFSVQQFFKMSVNRYTDIQKLWSVPCVLAEFYFNGDYIPALASSCKKKQQLTGFFVCLSFFLKVKHIS